MHSTSHANTDASLRLQLQHFSHDADRALDSVHLSFDKTAADTATPFLPLTSCGQVDGPWPPADQLAFMRGITM